MRWNWQQADWPNFSWDASVLAAAERIYIHERGILAGVTRHLSQTQAIDALAELLSDEAAATAEIEGDVLDRASLRSSMRRALGISHDPGCGGAREDAIARLTLAQYRRADTPLQAAELFAWHEILMRGRRDIARIGAYRDFSDAMHIVSGSGLRPKIHFEAPPSHRIETEMRLFFDRLDATRPGLPDALPAITRAGIAHLHFESIHPFEDGNGRIGRAISECVLAQDAPAGRFTVLSATILRRKKAYYAALEVANATNEITPWLRYFAEITLTAQYETRRIFEHVIAKAKFFETHRARMHPRCEKAMLRMFAAGPDGFIGGMSAGKYRFITDCSTATATRDLHALAEIDALIATGDRRHRRYALAVAGMPSAHAVVAPTGEVSFPPAHPDSDFAL